MANLNDLVQAVSGGTVREDVFQYHYIEGTWGPLSEHASRLRYNSQMQIPSMRDALLGTYLPIYEVQVQRQADAQYRSQRNLKVGIGGTVAALCLGGTFFFSSPVAKAISFLSIGAGVGIAASSIRKK